MIENLENKAWEKFDVFGDEGFLNIVATNSGVDGIKLRDGEDSDVPYVTRSDLRNGVKRFVSQDNYEFGSNDGGCITVGLDTQTAFYQPHRFITGQNIQIITGKTLNSNTALFYVTILRKQMEAKFNWGGNGATLSRMQRLKSMLPVNRNGERDFEYMGLYSRNKRNTMLNRYCAWVENQIRGLGNFIQIEPLCDKEFRAFSIVELFRLSRGKEGNMSSLIEGDVPLISAKNINNGLKGFVKEANVYGNCITLNNDGDGGAGLAYYQPFDMALDTHVTALIPKYEMSKYTMLFISKCISGLHDFFGHGLSISNKRAKNIKVMLPIDDNNNPDFEYMEQYVKNIMLKKYKQYLNFIATRQNE